MVRDALLQPSLTSGGCSVCGNRVKRSGKTYCSPACYQVARHREDRNCLECGRVFTRVRVEQECCSKSCGMRRVRRNGPGVAMTLHSCPVCQEQFEREARRVTAGFCSKSCAMVQRGRVTPLPDVAGLFWSKVQRGAAAACWPWLAGRSNRGYGHFHLRRKQMNASRAAWILTHGDIQPGLFVMHKCDNPPCCNPAHLMLGTPKDNVHDAIAKGRWNPREMGARGYAASRASHVS